jgi:DNA-binding MarR family transcriptional regulator
MKTKAPKASSRYRTPALKKGLDILELFASEPSGLTKSDVARKFGRTISEIFRMLLCLEERGYIAQSPEELRSRRSHQCYLSRAGRACVCGCCANRSLHSPNRRQHHHGYRTPNLKRAIFSFPKGSGESRESARNWTLKVKLRWLCPN